MDGTDISLTEFSFVGSSELVISLGTEVSRRSLPLIFASGYYIAIDCK